MSGVMGLRDEIDKKLAQAKGICNLIHAGGDLGVIGDRSIKASLWAVDELIEDAEKAVDALYEQVSRSVKEELQS